MSVRGTLRTLMQKPSMSAPWGEADIPNPLDNVG